MADFWVKVIGKDKFTVLGEFDLDQIEKGLTLMGGGPFYITIFSKSGSGDWSAVW